MKVFNSFQDLAAGKETTSQMGVFDTEVSVHNAVSETGSGNPQEEIMNATLATPLVTDQSRYAELNSVFA